MKFEERGGAGGGGVISGYRSAALRGAEPLPHRVYRTHEGWEMPNNCVIGRYLQLRLN